MAGGARLSWVDHLKVVLVGAVIVTHCALTYGADGSWFYQEPTPSKVVATVLGVPIALGALFAMGLFFFVAGCFVRGSLARKGRRRFVVDRLVRLGIPVLLSVLVVVPAIEWVVARATGAHRQAGDVWADQLRNLDAGPLWFAAVLLLFSLTYAAGRRSTPVGGGREVTAGVLLGAVAGIAVASFVLRLRFAIDSFQIGSSHLWQWGQCAGLFTLGVWAGEAGLAPLRPSVRRACRWAVSVGCLGAVALIGAYHDHLDPLGGGARWQSALVALIEGVVCVSATVVVLDAFRRRSGGSRFGGAAYGAYVLQAPVVVGVALAMRPLPLDGAIKLVVLAPTAVVLSFATAAALRRHPAARRYL